MKRVCAAVVLCALLCGCAAAPAGEEGGQKRYEASFLTLFDTVTTMVGYADSQETFTAQAQQIHDELLEYHQLYDIYNDYDGMNNLKTVNDNAGIAPVEVDARILDMLEFSRELYEETGGRVNVAMGGVLSLWHDAREAGIEDPANAYLPDQDALEEAARHAHWSNVVIDEEAGTVYLADPDMSLDVGAIAKGYAVERVCETAPAGMLISVGGNVRATGPKPDGSPWVVGIENPDGGDFLHTLYVEDSSVVTSGDYQRYYLVDGQRYHHIIDPDTLYPATRWRSVSILCADSGIADGLSTALFTLSQEDGQKLLDAFDAEALWMTQDGQLLYSPGFQAMVRT
ncbi:MAG TPA: FAD:protein FMN transferase [Candidatus Avoscillospira avistercoris]|uniref:FAD:protein FMN transferase n=1 Tax=Candidatus Avoscillospira avistercoris TaxID=2840707 RepID=A0A9D1F856_9FIRM|nr:FAD:protein FMN transferase [Candidatus Avoscillospira avistercoris]